MIKSATLGLEILTLGVRKIEFRLLKLIKENVLVDLW